MTGQTGKNGAKDVETMALSKYLSNFQRTLEMPLNNCKTILMLTWSKSCFLVAGTLANQESTFTLTETKRYVPVVSMLKKVISNIFFRLQK